MGPGLNPEPNLLQPASSEDQELSCLQSINSGEISNPANEKSLRPVSILRLVTCSSNPPSTISTNNNPPAPDARSFPEMPICDPGRPLCKIGKSTYENGPNWPK
ncbi:hypothetical protein DSO57_1000029, partial [Entomophthora muscae]